MPKRTDINTILIIGAGPITIGQACEFDYSGTQACKALKQEGYRLILLNSNPATIMTDTDLSDQTYIEPLTTKNVEKIIIKDKVDAILATMGGQTALNLAVLLHEQGILSKYKIELIGAKYEVIQRAEDRNLFKKAIAELKLESPKSMQVSSLEQANQYLAKVKLPLVIRPSFTLAGIGGGIAYNREEFNNLIISGLAASPVSTVLIEESLEGYKEFEMEVVCDNKDNAIIVCSIENVDPMGIHTGDSVTVAPALTLTDKEFQKMRNASIAILRKIGVDTGGSNVQFCVNPKNGRMLVIEMNPRVSRSSALASKATGFPIAKVAALLAVGYSLDELQNDITKITPASFEPSIDYIVTKIPRFTFEKFPETSNTLGTSMKSVGEAMAIGVNFKESLQKALRSIENNLTGLDNIPISSTKHLNDLNHDQITLALVKKTPDKLLIIAQAFRKGIPSDVINSLSKIDPFFINQIRELVETENYIINNPTSVLEPNSLREYKINGFSDKRLATLSGHSEQNIKRLRKKNDIVPIFRNIDSTAAEIPSKTSYNYSSYFYDNKSKVSKSNKKKVIIIGSGPNRIGQGIEFDYCCVSVAYQLQKLKVNEPNLEAIMINSNPETISTDYDTVDRLYFEPLVYEEVAEIIDYEKSLGNLIGVIVQFGGQTSIKIAADLDKNNIPILGTSYQSIKNAEDRNKFLKITRELNIKTPQGYIAKSYQESLTYAKKLGYPVMVRPSFVLGGRSMRIISSHNELIDYLTTFNTSFNDGLLIDKFLKNATEFDVDAISDGVEVIICGIMQHIENAGIHSGDSACVLPCLDLSSEHSKAISSITTKLAKKLKIKGLLNIQIAIFKQSIYVLEANPRASRTIPFVAKATGVPICKIATAIILGHKLNEYKHYFINKKNINLPVCVKEAVFPFSKFVNSDILLGPEMLSTGEVMGLDKNFGLAFAKAQEASGTSLPTKGTVFISICDDDKPLFIPLAKKLQEFEFDIIATIGTALFLQKNSFKVEVVNKRHEGGRTISDIIIDGEVDLMFNTSSNFKSVQDSKYFRRLAIAKKIPYSTNYSACRACLVAIEQIKKLQNQNNNSISVIKSLQEFYTIGI